MEASADAWKWDKNTKQDVLEAYDTLALSKDKSCNINSNAPAQQILVPIRSYENQLIIWII